MSAALEQQYRRALRWYPKSWRRRNEDVVVGTLLDVAEERGDRTSPKVDLASLRLHGLAERLGFAGRALPPAIRDRVSAIALGTGLAISVWATVFNLVSGIMPAGVSLDYGSTRVTFGPFASLGIILYLLWVAAFVAAILGSPTLMRILFAATLPAAIIARVLSEHLGMNLFPSTTTVLLLEMFAVLALLGTPRREARWRIWVGASAVTALGTLSYYVISEGRLAGTFGYVYFERGFFDPMQPFVGWICAIAPALAILCLALHRWIWAGVSAISFLPWLSLFLYGLSIRGSLADITFWAIIVIVLAGAATALALRGAGFGVEIRLTRR